MSCRWPCGGLIAKAYECDEEEVSLDDNEMVEVKVLMALAEENDAISKEGARNCKWHVNTEILKENKNLRTELKELTTITETWLNSSNKVNQCISEQIPSQKKRILRVDQLIKDPSSSGQKDLVFVKSSADDTKVSIPDVERPWLSEAKGFILSNHDTELGISSSEPGVIKHVNTEILKENKNLRSELKELKAITKTWLNSSNKVNQYIIKQIPSQKKIILGVDQLTEDPSRSGQKDLVFVKSLADDTKVTIPGVERPWLSEAQATEYDSADESSICSTLLPALKKLEGAEPISGPKTIKLILKSKSTLKAVALKCVIINKPSSAPAKDNKSSSSSKVQSVPAGKLKSVKIKDDSPLAIVMKELNCLKLQVSKNQSSYPRSNQS
ncbi:hypothetical protein Tco_0716746 [Tanacetum coccineum]